MRLIDADELYKKAMDIIQDKASYKAFAIINAISIAPTIEAKPVRHGKWTDECSVCSASAYEGLDADVHSTFRPSYCPNCGARMDGGESV